MGAKKSEHAVAKSAWCIEAHGKDGIFMYYFDNDYYEIPYEVMIPVNQTYHNLWPRYQCRA